MKLSVRCHDCGKTWLVDERSAGGEMLCSNCMARVFIGPSSAKPVAAQRSGTGGPTTRDPRMASAVVADQRPGVALEEMPSDPEVTCPRCKLHFVPRRQAPSAEEQPRRTVLVVEQQEYFRDLAVDALSPGCLVKIAANMDEARAMLACGSVDLLILDLTLDGAEGSPELLRSLQPKPCPILILTAQDESQMDGQMWEELRLSGADDLVIKGMSAAESLARKAAALLGLFVDEDGCIR